MLSVVLKYRTNELVQMYVELVQMYVNGVLRFKISYKVKSSRLENTSEKNFDGR